MLVREIMSSPAVTVPLSMPAPDVARLMRDRDIGSVVVIDQAGTLAGIITESDFTGIGRCVPFSLDLAPVIFGHRAASWDELKKIYDAAAKLTAREIMGDKNVETTTETESIGDAVHRMTKRDIKHLPVLKDGKPVGMLARADILKLLMSKAASL